MESTPGRVGPEMQHYVAMPVVPEKKDHIEVRLLAIDTRKDMPMGEDTISNLGPSGVRALPLAEGINVGGHYF